LQGGVVWIVFITTEAAGVSVSSMLSRLIAGKIGASDDHARADSSASSDYQENDAVRFNVALPKNILGILEASAVRKGHTIIWHIASVLTCHASIEMVYDNTLQAQAVTEAEQDR
jgi:hypothetical protein